MNQSLTKHRGNDKVPEPSRKDQIAGFLRTYRLTYKQLGDLLGVSDQGAYKILNADEVSADRLAQLTALPYPFPRHLLPKARRDEGPTAPVT